MRLKAVNVMKNYISPVTQSRVVEKSVANKPFSVKFVMGISVKRLMHTSTQQKWRPHTG